ncbi:MAG: type II toxin-antitoxin system YafQ family toxin [Tannerella sp.]|jgi:mRNA interferase YafQ|nr:type II toxin-antitoxin system YafQ family toxin [Tannerella sp.]
MRQNTNLPKRMTVKEFFNAVENLEGTIYHIQITNRFKKSLYLSFRRNMDLELLKTVIHILAKGKRLDIKYNAHALEGYKTIVWECHIKPDWLLLWQQNDEQLILILLDTGTHSDLF